ncbi:MAG: hypothetical protein ACRDD8_15315 [Bacteroidales bacterium]
MANSISISDFNFELQRTGIYKVTYTSPNTNKAWSCVVTNMAVIDAVKNTESPSKADMERLKRYIKKTYIV